MGTDSCFCLLETGSARGAGGRRPAQGVPAAGRIRSSALRSWLQLSWSPEVSFVGCRGLRPLLPSMVLGWLPWTVHASPPAQGMPPASLVVAAALTVAFHSGAWEQGPGSAPPGPRCLRVAAGPGPAEDPGAGHQHPHEGGTHWRASPHR